MKRIITIIIVLVVIGGLSYPKVKPWLSSSGEEQVSANSRGNNLLEVEAVEMDYETIDDEIFSSGTIQANEVVELSAEASGIITDIYFEEGREVQEGDLLLKINDSELQAQKQRAEFRLALAEQREERQRRLLERGGISQEDYDATLNEVNVLRSEIQLINAQIDKTEIRAPFSGVIGLKYVSVGSYIGPNTRIASLQEVDPIKIDFSVPERYISRVNVGDEILYSVQGVDSTFTGEVYAIEPRINTETRTLQIRAISENDDQLLYPGAFANITLILDEINDALMVPTISIIPGLNSQKVFVASDGVVEERIIRSGIRNSQKVQVIEGIEQGDIVLTTGLLQVRPGMEVNITEITKSTEI
ncbi:MAG: efflux RND transporter periplasmic adaptor subunit [Balneolaceae bacterium]|nr:efflux RND transporter periplasmic adaptor subunit [Balneolaceae bacterium]MDR9407806.1 efflux RND transporter periplasmic adaptor subunit [Balneolaceae bacterium]